MVNLVTVIAAFVPRVLAWGGYGHKIVAKIATDPQLLSPNALAYILEHFPETESRLASDALVPIADWADEVTASDAYHFTNTPYRDCQPFVAARDCGFGATQGLCLSTGIELYFNRATDLSLPPQERKEAIMFLVHFVADASQPLHTGFREDAGGNGIQLSSPANTSLHQLWDYGILDAHRASKRGVTWEAIADMLTLKAVDRRATIELGSTSFVDRSFAVRMVSDTVMNATCKSAYSFAGPVSWIETGYAADRAYTMSRSAVVLSQLIKAGVWLAQVLNEVAKIYSARTGAVRAIAKESARAAFVPTTPLPTSGAIPTHNFFSVIELHFDPEAHLYTTEAEEARPAAGAGAGAGALRPKPTPPSVDDEALMAAAAAENAKHVHFGIQMDALILIKRRGRYLVTSPSALVSGTGGLYVVEIFLRAGAAPVPFQFARAVFHSELILTQALVTTVFSYLSGSPLAAAVGVDGNVTAGRIICPLDDMRTATGRRRTDGREYEIAARISASVPDVGIVSAGALSDVDFVRQSRKMMVLSGEKVSLLSYAELLKGDVGIQRLRVNRFALTGGCLLFVDVRVHDGDLSNKIAETIMRVNRLPANLAHARAVMKENPKLVLAIVQIEQSLSPNPGPPVGGTAVVRTIHQLPNPASLSYPTFDIILVERV